MAGGLPTDTDTTRAEKPTSAALKAEVVIEQKSLINAFNKLSRNSKSVLYTSDSVLTKNQLKKLAKSSLPDDKYFIKQYKRFQEDSPNVPNDKILIPSSVTTDNNNNNNVLPLVTRHTKAPFYNRSSLYSIGGPFELMHVDVADVNFTRPSATDPKYVMLAVDLFSSKIYAYPMKRRNNLLKYLTKLYEDLVKEGRDESEQPMRLQSDQEFLQSDIKILNKKHNVIGFASKLNEGHAFAAEQKIRDLKTYINRAQRLSGTDSGKKKKKKHRLNGYDNVKAATERLNSVKSVKYDTIPNKVQRITAKNDDMRALYNGYRLKKVQQGSVRYDKYLSKKYRRAYKRLRLLAVGDPVLALSSRIRKKDTHNTAFYKPSTDKKSAFNKEYIFNVRQRLKVRDNVNNPHYYYWLRLRDTVRTGIPRSVKKLEHERFTRSELFAVNRNTEST